MFSISQVLIGLGLVGAGILMVKYSYQLLTITGEQFWMERFTGSGSTNGMYKLFGVVLVILGLLVATGFGNSVMNFIFSPFKNLFLPIKST